VSRGAALLIVTLAVAGFAGPAAGQQASGYVPKKTAWGDPDFRGTWPVEQFNPAGIPLERPPAFGDRLLMTDEEFAERLEAAKRSDEGYANEVGADGTVGLADWLLATPFGRRTSQIVDPTDGRLPPMTPEGEALFRAGRNSWIDGLLVDWITDLDAYDRCLPRGFPASMLPWPGGNGIRVFQSPGFVVLQLEILGTRIVPLGSGEAWPAAVRGWFGQSRGHWQGDTLVIETTNIVAGDSATDDVWQRASSPLPGRGKGTIPMSVRATAVERLTMTGPDTIAYTVTYADPDVFTAPWTVELEWTRDSNYRLHEYACHEGNVAIRDMIKASRAQRKLDAAASAGQ
jgi:hypothetical protein